MSTLRPFGPGILRDLVPALILGMTLGACQGSAPVSDPGLRLEMAVSPTPASVGRARVILTLTDSAGAAALAQVTVVATLPGSEGPPMSSTAEAAEGGRYVAEIDLPEPGEWVLDAAAHLPGGRTARARRPLTVVAPVGGG